MWARAVIARRLWLGAMLCVALLLVCERSAKPVNLPPPVQATAVGVGDVFVMHIVGEDKLPKEYTVASDGSVDIPYIHRVQVEGLEPQQISDLVREQLMAKSILSDPSVTISVKAYNSKRIVVSGEVKKAGSMPLEPGMTLLRAISQAGGLTPLARRSQIVLRRKIGDETKRVVVDYDAINDNEIPDVPLQAGDTIHVEQSTF
jgi:polysaccharide export outer membrane protein